MDKNKSTNTNNTNNINKTKHSLKFKALIISAVLSISLSGCSEEDVIDTGSKMVSDYIVYSIDNSNTDSILNDSDTTLKSDEPNIIDKQPSTENQNSLDSIDTSKFYYNQLNETEQSIYNQLLETVAGMKKSTTLDLGGLSVEDISIIFRAVRYEHPEIYWIQGFKYITDENNTSTLEFYPNYIIDKNEKSEYDTKLKVWTERVESTVQQKESAFEKEKEIYDFIVYNTKYNVEASLNQSLISAVNGETVCLGFTKAMKYLCDKNNIPCVIVEGMSKSTGIAHSWNKVYIDNEWYNIDLTNSSTAKIFSDTYDMFNITDELIGKQFKEVQMTSGAITFNYPVADSIEDDYYNRNGLYITNVDELNEKLNSSSNSNSDSDNVTTITIRVATDEMMNTVSEFIKNNVSIKSIVTMDYIHLIKFQTQ